MSQIGVYVITEKETGCFYIGSTQKLVTRLERHCYELNRGTHHNHRLQELWNNGAREFNVSFTTIQNRSSAYDLEEEMIQFFKNSDKLLNIGLSSRGGDNLTRNPNKEDIIERITSSIVSRMNAMSPEERKETYGRNGSENGMFGKTHTPEARAAMSSVNIGNSYAVGAVRSFEQRQRLSEFAKTRIGEKNPFHGKKHSQETKARIAMANTGRLPVNVRKVSVNGVIFESATAASRELKTVTATILHRIKSKNPKYKDYHYIT